METSLQSLTNQVKRTIATLIENNRFDMAEQLLAEMDPSLYDSEIFSFKTIIFTMQGDYQAAAASSRLGLISDPSAYDHYYNLGYIHMLQGDLEEALAYFVEARKLCSNQQTIDVIHSHFHTISQQQQQGDWPRLLEKSDSGHFSSRLAEEVIRCRDHYYPYNIDFHRHGQLALQSMIVDTGLMRKQIVQLMEGLSNLYDHLADDSSKSLLVKLMCYRILGHHKVKLPQHNHDYWEKRKQAKALICSAETIPVNFMNWSLNQYDLTQAGFPAIRLFLTQTSIHHTFLMRHYDCGTVKAAEGDVIIDAGACWGDTALYFAHLTGNQGKVYSYEFIDSNIAILKRNLAMNPHLEGIVEIVESPLWSEDGLPMYCIDNGPGSVVSFTPNSGKQVRTSTIDSLVISRGLSRVDFIKMDIEGAELQALMGAEQTIRTFKPKLAISLYHKLQDFVDIIRYLQNSGVDYRYYLNHVTIHAEETVLFAEPAS